MCVLLLLLLLFSLSLSLSLPNIYIFCSILWVSFSFSSALATFVRIYSKSVRFTKQTNKRARELNSFGLEIFRNPIQILHE
jgi:hypothetical protein